MSDFFNNSKDKSFDFDKLKHYTIVDTRFRTFYKIILYKVFNLIPMH